MEEFKVGDSVIINNDKPLPGNEIAPPIIVGQRLEVKEVLTCKCGSKHIDLGLKSKVNWVSCFECSENLPRGSEIHWCHPSRLTKSNI